MPISSRGKDTKMSPEKQRLPIEHDDLVFVRPVTAVKHVAQSKQRGDIRQNSRTPGGVPLVRDEQRRLVSVRVVFVFSIERN